MKKLMIVAALCLMGMAAHAQQNLSWGQGPQVASPDVHADNSVTFNLIAPEAKKVQITGDMLPTKKVEFAGNTYDTPGVVDLVKNEKGVWSYTTEPLKPELYTYNMIVDGVKIIDPLNVYNIRDINNLFSVLLIGGDQRQGGSWHSKQSMVRESYCRTYTPPHRLHTSRLRDQRQGLSCILPAARYRWR